MGTPVSKDILLAYLTAKHGNAEQIIAENLAESRSQHPRSILGWIGEYFHQMELDSANGETVVTELIAALEATPTMGENFKEYIRAAQVAEMCETYRYLADAWNWKEGPASQHRVTD